MPIKLVASDLDGTLLYHNNFIPYKNLEAINSINDKNINFTICTGKTYCMTKDICSRCKASYGIFGNGTQIINLKTGQEIYRNTVNIDDFNVCYDIAKQNNLHIHLYTDTKMITEKLMYLDLRNYQIHLATDNTDFLEVVPNIKDYVNSKNPQIFKLVISSR